MKDGMSIWLKTAALNSMKVILKRIEFVANEGVGVQEPKDENLLEKVRGGFVSQGTEADRSSTTILLPSEY